MNSNCSTEGLESLVHSAVVAVRGRSETHQPAAPRQCVAAIRVTPDISQKGLANTNYCAPCAAANVLGQMHQRELLSLPQRWDHVVSSDDDAVQAGRSLARHLGEDTLMETRQRQGTNRYRLVRGMDRFVRDSRDASLMTRYLGSATTTKSSWTRSLAAIFSPRWTYLGCTIFSGDYRQATR